MGEKNEQKKYLYIKQQSNFIFSPETQRQIRKAAELTRITRYSEGETYEFNKVKIKQFFHGDTSNDQIDKSREGRMSKSCKQRKGLTRNCRMQITKTTAPYSKPPLKIN